MLIICNGMIRSGSTLQYNLARGLIEEASFGQGEGFFSERQAQKSINELISWKDDERYHLIKMHQICPLCSPAENKGLRSLYIYRDLRDVAVSAKSAFHYTKPQLMKALDEAVLIFNEIQRLPNVLTQRYEDVIRDVHKATWDIADFLNVKLTSGQMHDVIDSCAIPKAVERTEKMEKRFWSSAKEFMLRMGLPMKTYDKKTLLHSNHISGNKGAAGVWRSQLNSSELNEINNRFGKWLKEQGYE